MLGGLWPPAGHRQDRAAGGGAGQDAGDDDGGQPGHEQAVVVRGRLLKVRQHGERKWEVAAEVFERSVLLLLLQKEVTAFQLCPGDKDVHKHGKARVKMVTYNK